MSLQLAKFTLGRFPIIIASTINIIATTTASLEHFCLYFRVDCLLPFGIVFEFFFDSLEFHPQSVYVVVNLGGGLGNHLRDVLLFEN